MHADIFTDGHTGGQRLDNLLRRPNNDPSNAPMARIRITYWQEIPVLVTARDGAGEATVPLSQRFQDLVDTVAMQAGLVDAEAYLAQWRTGPEEERPGSARDAAGEVAAELEERFADTRAQYARPGGPFEAH